MISVATIRAVRRSIPIRFLWALWVASLWKPAPLSHKHTRTHTHLTCALCVIIQEEGRVVKSEACSVAKLINIRDMLPSGRIQSVLFYRKHNRKTFTEVKSHLLRVNWGQKCHIIDSRIFCYMISLECYYTAESCFVKQQTKLNQ